MAANVTEHEPEVALFVPDTDPLIFYRAIARLAHRSLVAGGALYFEIHEQMAEQMAELLSSEGFTNVEIRQDLNSKPRMARAYKK
jgi:release factor glutamine methyltransferase